MNTRFANGLAAVGVVVGLTVPASANAPDGRYTTANGTVYDTRTKLTWQQAVPTTAMWGNAKTYCSDLSLSGTGWRLPTVKELQTIVDQSRTNPSIDPNAFPSTGPEGFWSSSPCAGLPGSAWIVSFDLGKSACKDGGYNFWLRCVR